MVESLSSAGSWEGERTAVPAPQRTRSPSRRPRTVGSSGEPFTWNPTAVTTPPVAPWLAETPGGCSCSPGTTRTRQKGATSRLIASTAETPARRERGEGDGLSGSGGGGGG